MMVVSSIQILIYLYFYSILNYTLSCATGKKVFESGFSVDGNLDIDMINGHLFKEIVTKSSAQTIEGIPCLYVLRSRYF